jgi:hypothetical protein
LATEATNINCATIIFKQLDDAIATATNPGSTTPGQQLDDAVAMPCAGKAYNQVMAQLSSLDRLGRQVLRRSRRQ